MPSMVIKQIRSWQIPRDLPHRPAELANGTTVRLAIDFDGHGYCLLATELDGVYTLNTWHPSLKAAEADAAQLFGPTSKDWETMGLQ